MALTPYARDVKHHVSAVKANRDWSSLASGAFIALALAVGLVAGLNPLIGVLLAMALAYMLVVTSDLALGVCGFLLLTFIDVLSGGADLSLTKAAGVLLVGGWLAAIVTTRGVNRDLLFGAPWLTVILVAFLAWSAISSIWAEDPSMTLLSTQRFALNAVLFPIIFLAVRDERRIVWILATFVVGALLSVAWGVTQDPTVGASADNAAEGRLSGATVEANVLAVMLMVAIVFAGSLTLVLRRRLPLASAVLASAAVIGLIAFFATLSRGGVVSFVAVLLIGLVYGGRLRPAILALTLAAIVIGGVYVTTSPAAAERLSRESTSGRSDIWTVAGRMVKAHPVLGVGSGNFTTVEAHYLLYPGGIERDDLILDRPRVAHNVYLHILAEMGVVGLCLFIGVIATALGSAVRAVGIFRARGQPSLELLGRAIVIALIGILVADFFSSEQYSKQLWLLLAMGPALLAVARQGSSVDDAVTPVTRSRAAIV